MKIYNIIQYSLFNLKPDKIKKDYVTLASLLSMLTLLLFSCSKVIYTHEYVLNTYRTKPEVMLQFGIPTERITTTETEQWLYWYDGPRYTDEFRNVKTIEVTEFSSFSQYLVFTFDKQGNVINRNCNGVDFTKRKNNTGGTLALVALGAGAAVLVVMTLSYSAEIISALQ
jgi:hypothetical protein